MLDLQMQQRLDALFFPRSVAVIGASETPGKWGFMLVVDILGGGYRGQIYPINPGRASILGLTAYSNVREVPGEVDLAILTIPARGVPEALEDCIAKGIHTAMIISSGFKETGPEGKLLEDEIVAIARRGSLLFIGPNTMGTVSTHHRLISAGAPIEPLPGGLSIISQSGNLGLQIMQWSNHRGLGLGFYAGTGNEAMLRTSDLLRYFGQRDEVKSVALYIEGIADGREFMAAAREVTRQKPVVALKTGRSQTGSKAAQSHSGSMAGAYATYSAMFRQTGIIQVRSPSELINVAGAMAHLPVPRSNRVGVMTLGGGWGIITADECEDSGLSLPPLSAEIIRDIDKRLPAYWNRSNPVDMVGEENTELQLHIMQLLAEWDAVDSIIALGVVGRIAYVEEFISCHEKVDGTLFSKELKMSVLTNQLKVENRIYTEIARLQQLTGKPIIAVSLGEGEPRSIIETEHGQAMVLTSPEEAVTIIAHMARYRDYLNKPDAPATRP